MWPVPRGLPNGLDPSRNQSEYGAPIRSAFGDAFQRNGMRLCRGFQTYTPGPFHFEDAWGMVGVSGYFPSPIYPITLGFKGDVPLRESPKFVQPSPWRRGAIY